MIDSVDYLAGGKLTLQNGLFDKFLFDGGYIQKKKVGLLSSQRDTISTYYYNKDHLGNICEVFDDAGSIKQITNYYPFGLPCWGDSVTSGSSFQPYKYNGKEYERTHGLNGYDYGARQYNSAIGMFTSIDPLCEKYFHISPYAYCGGNPINRIDPDGDTINVVNKNNEFLFALDDGFQAVTAMTTKQLYEKGIQWFAPSADDYMKLLYMNKGIIKDAGIKHFTWEDIVQFSEIDRSSLSYRTGGSGDWKATGNPGDGYLMVTVDGMPYWADAIGQIPFALNTYRNSLVYFLNPTYAEYETIKIGQKFGTGDVLKSILGKPDNSNNYDNEMIRRAVKWAQKRYIINGRNPWNNNGIIKVTNFSPQNLSRPL